MYKRLLVLLSFIAGNFLPCNVNAQTPRTISEPAASRQVHLDFHTSESIPSIGEKFNRSQFQQALKVGNINQVNIFAKDHHSWSYYPTAIGKTHPNLKFDLLGEQIKACHEIGIKCPVYFTVGWSAQEAEDNPEWCVKNKDGSTFAFNYEQAAKGSAPKPFYSWKCLNPVPNSPYHQKIIKQVEELCKKYPIDGFWFDIYHIAKRDYSRYSLDRMKKEGIDIDDSIAVEKSYANALKAHMKELRVLVARYHPKATVFFNSATHPQSSAIFTERLYDMNTSQDLEDLPSTWGGYDKLPLEAKYHLGQGTPATAMSGKFHKAWGEFGGFKHPDALKYEAAAMISFGVACNFGDQLHPSGEMDMETYKRIGYAYEYVKKIEPYGLKGTPVSRLGMGRSLDNAAAHGVVNMLLETHNDFVIANENNLNNINVLIIPSGAALNVVQADKINAWAKSGGKVIVFGKGALNEKKSNFALDLGLDYVGKSPYQFDYTTASSTIQKNLVSSPFLNYESGLLVKLNGAKPLARIREPYFNRTYAQYSGHRETPYKLIDSEYPAVSEYQNIIFFSHNLDQLYYAHGVNLHRQLFSNVLDLVDKSPMLKVFNLPSCGRVSLLDQPESKRYVAHLLYAPALQRGEVTVIEDLVPISAVRLQLSVPKKIKGVVSVPGNFAVPFKQEGQNIVVKVPTFTMHTALVFNY